MNKKELQHCVHELEQELLKQKQSKPNVIDKDMIVYSRKSKNNLSPRTIRPSAIG
jgi:hypothetical protein